MPVWDILELCKVVDNVNEGESVCLFCVGVIAIIILIAIMLVYPISAVPVFALLILFFIGKASTDRKSGEGKYKAQTDMDLPHLASMNKRDKLGVPSAEQTGDSEQKDVDIREFLTKLKPSEDPLQGVYLREDNFKLFYDFVSHSKETLDIITNKLDGEILVKLLSAIINKNVRIRIITRNYDKRARAVTEALQKSELTKVDIQIYRCRHVHAKIMLRDSRRVIIGSSNITDASMSQDRRFSDANVITSEKKDVSVAKGIFDSLWSGSDKTINIREPNIIYSRNGGGHLPEFIEDLIKKEKVRTSIFMSISQIDKSILDKILEIKGDGKLRLLVSHKPFSGEFTSNNMDAFRLMKDAMVSESEDIEVHGKKADIHAKIYVFEGQHMAFVSSMNLTENSWWKMLESGIALKGEMFENLINQMNQVPYGKIDISGAYIEIEKPKSKWSSESSDGLTKLIPWELGKPDKEFAYTTRQIEYYRWVKEKIREPESKNKGTHSPSEGSGTKGGKFKVAGGFSLTEQQCPCKYCGNPTTVIMGGGVCAVCKSKGRGKDDESFSV